MKKVLKLVVAMVVVLVIALGVVWFYIGAIAKTAIEKGGTYALGVPTTVDGVNIGVASGEAGIRGLRVANPEGFKSTQFLELLTGDVAVSLGTLRQEKVEIPLLALSDLTLTLEKQDAKANYEVILNNLKRFESKDPQTEPEQAGGKTFVIKQVTIRNITVHADMISLMGKTQRVTIRIPEIDLQNVGSGSDNGVVMSELTGVLTKAILRAIVESSGNLLPAVMLDGIGSGLAGLKDVSALGVKVVGDVTQNVTEIAGKISQEVGKVTENLGDAGKAIEGVGQNLGDAGKKIGEDAGDALKNVGDGLGGLFGGKKEQKQEPATGQ